VRRPDVRTRLGLPWNGAFAHPTLVMGIVNVTPDSFQPEGRHPTPAGAAVHALRLAAEGADILDIGGESTRPGATEVPVKEELNRVMPVIESLVPTCRCPISIDTRKADVAARALMAGASIVNDVSAGTFDERMLSVVAEAGATICLMHCPTDPKTMAWSTGANPAYRDVVTDVRDYLARRVEAALAAGIAPERIWVDPGFGFGKSVRDNLTLLRRLDEVAALGYPVLVGVSRKSTLGRILGDLPPEQRLEASVAAAAMAIHNGACIVRTHDVEATVRAMLTVDAIVFGENTK
jgi:dihydropteroate synthase